MSTLVKTNVYQMICDRLDEEVVSSPTEDTKVVNWLNRNYEHNKQVLLCTGRWNFAKARDQIARDVAVPAFEWDYQYTLPEACLGFYPLTVDGTKNSSRIRFEFEGEKILTGVEGPLNLRFIKDVSEEKFHPLFTEYLICELAVKMAHWMTGKLSMLDQLEPQLKKASRRANLFNALQNDATDPVPEEIILVRDFYI